MGMDANTIIKTNTGNKSISEINIGDLLSDNNRVLGKIEINPMYFRFYKFKQIILSSNFKVYSDNLWQNIELVYEAVEVKKPIKAYHLTTERGYFYSIHNVKLRDYNETDDLFVNKKIDELIKLI